VLRGLVASGGAAAIATNPVAEALPPAIDPATGLPVTAAPAPPPVTALSAEDITIQPVTESNSIVVRARAEVQDDLAALISQLDQRRPQVLIEAAIVEVSGDISEQLGIQLGFGAATPPGGFAATSFSNAGPSLDGILTLLGVPAATATSGGLAIGLSRQDKFGLLLQALGQSSKANLLSTPSITTLDNQAAEIVVGQNVPFRTGSFDPGGGGDAFTTIERQDVGITMRVTPRVNQGDVIQLDISQEVSSLVAATVAGAADLITNRRSIQTTVLADNGGTIVLGGLITDDRQSTRSEVPGLGRLPVVGGLFRSRSESNRRQTLFVFLRATILRDGAAAEEVSSERFQRLRAIEAIPTDQGPGLLAEPQPVRRLPVEIEGLY
jgi:general secretion pathway protein D